MGFCSYFNFHVWKQFRVLLYTHILLSRIKAKVKETLRDRNQKFGIFHRIYFFFRRKKSRNFENLQSNLILIYDICKNEKSSIVSLSNR